METLFSLLFPRTHQVLDDWLHRSKSTRQAVNFGSRESANSIFFDCLYYSHFVGAVQSQSSMRKDLLRAAPSVCFSSFGCRLKQNLTGTCAFSKHTPDICRQCRHLCQARSVAHGSALSSTSYLCLAGVDMHRQREKQSDLSEKCPIMDQDASFAQSIFMQALCLAPFQSVGDWRIMLRSAHLAGYSHVLPVSTWLKK